MNAKHVALSTLVSLVLLFAGCMAPGETQANLELQNDIQSIINANEIAHGHPSGGKVVDTKIVKREGNTVVENWIVKRGDHDVVYQFQLIPDPKGGTFIGTTLPEEDRKESGKQ